MGNPWSGLRLVRRVEVFERTKSRRREGIFQVKPVVGQTAVFLGCRDEIAAVDRQELSVLWRLPLKDLEPLLLWSENKLLLRGYEHAGMLDLQSGELVWTVEDYFPYRWREWLISGTEEGFRLVEMKTGEVTRELLVSPPKPSGGAICGDLMVFLTAETGDPIRCMSLMSGPVLWKRNILREVREAFGIEDNTMSMAPGTVGHHFIGTLGGGELARIIYCSLEDGHILWNVGMEVPHGPQVIEGKLPVLANHRFVVIDEASGKLLCDRTYDSLWGLYYPRKGSIYGDKIAFVSESGHVPVFDLNDGRLVWLGRYEMTFQGSVEVDGRLLVAAADGRLWVFEGAGEDEAGAGTEGKSARSRSSMRSG